MKPKPKAKPEAKKPEAKKPERRAPPPQVLIPPRSRIAAPRASVAPHGRQPETLPDTGDGPPDLGPFSDEGAGPHVSYPIFPKMPAGTVESIRVYRTTSRNDGVPGMAWHQQALPWIAALTTWDDIARICGGGRFVVQAIASQRVIASAARQFDGAARTPNAQDVASIAPGLGLEENGRQTYETPNGWISIPGLSGATQAAFITFQQTAFNARDDANKAHAMLGLIIGQLAEKAMRPDPGLAVLQEIVEAQRSTLDRIYTELNTQRAEVTRLKIERASSGDETERVKVEAMRKGMDIVDGVAGVVAKKFLESETAAAAAAAAPAAAPARAATVLTAGTPGDLGAALARRAMEAVAKS